MNKLFVIIFLFLLFNYIQNVPNEDEEEIDLSIDEDDTKPTPPPKQVQPQQPKPHRILSPVVDDFDEFDDPNLLREQQVTGQSSSTPHHQGPGPRSRAPPNGHQIPNQPPTPPTQNKEEESTSEPMSPIKEFLFEHYDYFFMGFSLLFVVNVFYGRIVNRKKAYKWFNKNKSYYEENYAHLGFEKEYNQKSKSLFKPYAYNVYNFYASGRVFIQWMLITVSLKKRHDLVSIVTSFFYFGERDRVTYLSSVVPTNDVPVVFCLCKKVYAKTLQKKYSEISDFTEVINLSFMNDSLVMMTENFDFVDKLFREKTLRDMYLKIEPYLDTIFFSDRRTFVKDEYGLMVIFDISSIPNEEVLKDITLFTHMIIDGLAVGSVKVQYKKEANDRRKKFDVKRTREEEYEKRYKQKIEESQKKNKPTITREMAYKIEESKLKKSNK